MLIVFCPLLMSVYLRFAEKTFEKRCFKNFKG
jgi:hypothetical protein